MSRDLDTELPEVVPKDLLSAVSNQANTEAIPVPASNSARRQAQHSALRFGSLAER